MVATNGSDDSQSGSVCSSIGDCKQVGITSLLKDRPTLDQLLILMRADVTFKHKAGRYYGGLITEAEASMLVEGLKSHGV